MNILKIVLPLRIRQLVKITIAAAQGDLPRLAELTGTDKWGGHWDAKHYAKTFSPLHWKTLTHL